MKAGAVAGAVAFALLFARGAARVPASWSGEWDCETTMLATSSVFHRAHDGLLAPMGYPYLGPCQRTWRSTEIYDPYLRQVGALPAALAAVAPREDAALERFLLGSRYAFLALTCAVAALFVALCWSRLGPPAAAGAFVPLFASPWFADFGRSLYWAPFLALGAVTWAWFAWDRPRAVLLWVFAALVGLKCLDGYEHLSALVLVPLFVPALPAGLRMRERVLRGSQLAGAGVAGFAAAFAAHLAYLWSTAGAQLALENTVGKAWARSLGEPVSWRDHLRGAYGVFAHDKVLSAVVAAGLLALAVLALRWSRLEPARREGLARLAAAAAIAFAGGMSWLVLARGHTALAPQFNMLPFYFGPVMVLGAFAAATGAEVIRK